jgi:hypothetical protein
VTEKQVFPEWISSNEPAKYPFADHASLTNGFVEIARDLFLDARLYPIGGGARLFLSRIEIAGQDVTLTVAAPSQEALATGTYNLAATPDRVSFFDSFGRPAGILLSDPDKLATLGTIGAAVSDFTVNQTEFAPTVVVPTPELGVRGVVLETGEVFTGEIWFVGENGVVLRDDEGAIRVDVIGDPFARRSLCDDDGFELPPVCAVKSINDCFPNERGDLKITIGGNLQPDNILRIEQRNNRLLVKLVGQLGFQQPADRT